MPVRACFIQEGARPWPTNRPLGVVSAQAAAATKKSAKGKKEPKQFIVDCAVPADDKMVDVEAFATFLQQRIKVAGKTGNLGSAVAVAHDGKKITVTVEPTLDFSKRYAHLPVVVFFFYSSQPAHTTQLHQVPDEAVPEAPAHAHHAQGAPGRVGPDPRVAARRCHHAVDVRAPLLQPREQRGCRRRGVNAPRPHATLRRGLFLLGCPPACQ